MSEPRGKPAEPRKMTPRNVPFALPGWPRPRAWFDGNEKDRPAGMLPVPWFLKRLKNGVGWTEFHDDIDQAHTDRLCQVCGLRMDGTVVLGSEYRKRTSGAGCHPRCFALALRFCPHFNDMKYVAYRYDGPGNGYVVDTATARDVVLVDGDGEPYDGPFAGGNPIHRAARRMTVAEVRELAVRDPLGVGSKDDAFTERAA